MKISSTILLLIIIFFIIILIPSISAQDENLLPFYIYKGLHTGYTGIRNILLFTAPLLGPDDAVWIYSYFDNECHQLPERSFLINNNQIPLCARCTGIVIGSFAGQLSYYLFKDFYFSTIFEEHNFLLSIGIMILGILPLVIDGGMQFLTDYESNNTLRLGTGLLFGISLSLLYDVFIVNINRLFNYSLKIY